MVDVEAALVVCGWARVGLKLIVKIVEIFKKLYGFPHDKLLHSPKAIDFWDVYNAVYGLDSM